VKGKALKQIYPVIFPLLLFLFIPASPVKGASDWEEFKTYKGNVYSYNKATIKLRAEAIIQVWVKTVYSDEGRERHVQYMKKQGLSTAKDWYKLSDSLSSVEVDCRKEKTRVLYITYYYADGGILHSQSSNAQDWRAIVPDSPFDLLREKVCK
jgi:hypothetical protein